jgi:hypothetical protein
MYAVYVCTHTDLFLLSSVWNEAARQDHDMRQHTVSTKTGKNIAIVHGGSLPEHLAAMRHPGYHTRYQRGEHTRTKKGPCNL